MNKDWTGNNASTYITLGASNHTDKEREIHDYYATESSAAEWLCKLVDLDTNIWECACGRGDLSQVFENNGHKVYSTDLCDRGYGEAGIDFLNCKEQFDGDIITNPPYKYAQQFVEKAIELVPNGNKVCMFLKLQFLEGKSRRKMFDKYPPKYIYVSSSRLLCAKNGEFEKMRESGGSAVAYAWYVWEKGFKRDTVVRWFN